MGEGASWLKTKPDLLIIEVAVNDGDELLESTPNPDGRVSFDVAFLPSKNTDLPVIG